MEKVKGDSRRTPNAYLFWALMLAGMGLLFLAVALPVTRKRHTMEVMVDQMRARNVEIYDQFDRLDKERVALVSDPFYVEKLARRNLNMCRPGETQVRITTTSHHRRLRSAQRHLTATRPVGLWSLYRPLAALAEDSLLRQVALLLGGFTIFAGIILFGRSEDRSRA